MPAKDLEYWEGIQLKPLAYIDQSIYITEVLKIENFEENSISSKANSPQRRGRKQSITKKEA